MDGDLAARVRAWIDEDPDHAARAELRALLDRGDEAELGDRFAGRLTFGTAGLRGRVRAGPNGMNRAVVRRAAARPPPPPRPGGTGALGADARPGGRGVAAARAAR